MKLTYFEDKNYRSFFEKNKQQMKLFSLIGDHLKEKKRTLPCWDQYAYDKEGNIHHRFLGGETREWIVITEDLRNMAADNDIEAKINLTEKEIKEIAKEAWLSKED